jgi:type I restriction enzyme, R subunit
MTQIREEAFFTAGRVVVRGRTVQRGAAKKADYILYYKPNLPIAVVEAKDNNSAVGSGMQQALEYAEILDVSQERLSGPPPRENPNRGVRA